MRFSLLIVLVLSWSAGSVWAETAACPTGSALAAGESAFATYPDDGTVEMRWLGEGMVEETMRYPDGNGDFRLISVGGVLIVYDVELEGENEVADSRVTTRLPPELFDALPFRPEQELDVVAVNHFADGTEPEDERVELRAGVLAEVDIAGCRYEAFPLVLSYRWGEETFTSMMTHIPALGLSLELMRQEQGAGVEPFAPVRFSLQTP